MREYTGRTVTEAIEAGLQAEGLQRADVDVEVLDEGHSGLLGVGARPARVRLHVRTVEARPTEPAADQAAPSGFHPTPEQLETLAVARAFLQGLLERMELKTQVEGSIVPPDAEGAERYYLNIAGDDLSLLIGRRGETLDAIQHLVRLVVNKHTHSWPIVEVDVEHYKRRREHSLRRLAEAMAARAVSEKRTIVLEAMPPRERRIIHLALNNRADVYTESIGEGENRRVTIVPR
ncbi:MAG: protein jag [Caldilineales bacterium]|nr:protein jag [Caldilineales bacterium]